MRFQNQICPWEGHPSKHIALREWQISALSVREYRFEGMAISSASVRAGNCRFAPGDRQQPKHIALRETVISSAFGKSSQLQLCPRGMSCSLTYRFEGMTISCVFYKELAFADLPQELGSNQTYRFEGMADSHAFATIATTPQGAGNRPNISF
jgi:hypothetical protein